MQRRQFMQVFLCALGAMALLPQKVLAAWNKPAFDAEKLPQALNTLNMADAVLSTQIEIVAPDFAENGRIVQIEIKSNIPHTENITIFVEKNPTPLIASFTFAHGIEAQMITRIKMAESSLLRVVAVANGAAYYAEKMVAVAEGGCG